MINFNKFRQCWFYSLSRIVTISEPRAGNCFGNFCLFGPERNRLMRCQMSFELFFVRKNDFLLTIITNRSLNKQVFRNVLTSSKNLITNIFILYTFMKVSSGFEELCVEYRWPCGYLKSVWGSEKPVHLFFVILW